MSVNKNSKDDNRNLGQNSDRKAQGRKDINQEATDRSSESGRGSATGAARERGQQDFDARAAQEPARHKNQDMNRSEKSTPKSAKKDQR